MSCDSDSGSDCPKIAVLLAAYNGLEWIEEQVESIQKQNGVCVHLFISVDLSTDNTFEWCKELEFRYSNVTVLKYGERYGGATQNFFRLIRDVDFLNYDYVALADQDDIWMQTKLLRAVGCLIENNVDVYSSDVIAFWSDGKEALVKKSYPQTKYDYLFESGGPGCTFVFKMKSLLFFKEFMNSHWFEVNSVGSGQHDWLMYAFFRASGFSWFIDDEPFMKYRQHDANAVGFNSGYRAYLKRFSMVRNKWYRGQIAKLLSLIPKTDLQEFSLGKGFLIRNINSFRRRKRDVFILGTFIILGLF